MTSEKTGQEQPQVLRLRRSQSARTASLRMTDFLGFTDYFGATAKGNGKGNGKCNGKCGDSSLRSE
jgi:hypothetical protein